MTTLFDKMVLDRCDDDEPLTAWMPQRNAQIPEPLRSIVNAASPAVKPMREVECHVCGGSGFGSDELKCRYCNGRRYYLTDGIARETK